MSARHQFILLTFAFLTAFVTESFPQPGKSTTTLGETPIMAAIRAETKGAAHYNAIDRVRTLIARGADVNARTDDGTTALMLAVGADDTDCVRLLIDAHANVNAKDGDGRTAIMFVAGELWYDKKRKREGTAGNLERLKLLIDAGADTNERDNDGITPLIYAAGRGNSDDVKALIAAGAEVNTQSYDGETAIEATAASGCLSCAIALIRAGADVNAADGDGTTALMLVSSYGCRIYFHTEAASSTGENRECVNYVKKLLAFHANVNAKDKKGQTALMRAVRYGNAEFVKLLIASGAEVNARDGSGKTALGLAHSNEIASMLRAAGATK